MTKLAFGVGINDSDYPLNPRLGSKRNPCPFYTKWKDMLMRCYSEQYLRKKPEYVGCSVCDDWLVFTKFKAWMSTQDWHGKCLDKDIVNPGNKVYSPENCALVTEMTNNFVVGITKMLKGEMVGARKKDCGKYHARCRNPFNLKSEHIGSFDTELDAHLAWKARKHEHAIKLAAMQTDARVAESLLRIYA
jgi:hypothetical protein